MVSAAFVRRRDARKRYDEARSIKAEFDSFCPRCHEPIYEGDRIVPVNERREWVHVRCAPR